MGATRFVWLSQRWTSARTLLARVYHAGRLSVHPSVAASLVLGPQGSAGVAAVVQQCYSKMLLQHPKRVFTFKSPRVCHLPLCSSSSGRDNAVADCCREKVIYVSRAFVQVWHYKRAAFLAACITLGFWQAVMIICLRAEQSWAN